jgi:two-component system, NarL family, sensor kinase
MYSAGEEIIFLVFISLFVLIMITFIIVILFYFEKKQRAFTHTIIAVKADYEMELYRTKLEIKEQTSQYISMDIHDNVGQSLSLAKMILSTLEPNENYEIKEGISETAELLEFALDNLRHIGRTLNSEIVKKGGLKNSIELQVAYIQRRGKINIQLHVNGKQIGLEETKEIFLYRIVQEAINNILRHANATSVNIYLVYSTDSLKLQIEDNGKGFDLNAQISAPNQFNGIYNMQNRAKLIGAEFIIESTVGRGTNIIIISPY